MTVPRRVKVTLHNQAWKVIRHLEDMEASVEADELIIYNSGGKTWTVPLSDVHTIVFPHNVESEEQPQDEL